MRKNSKAIQLDQAKVRTTKPLPPKFLSIADAAVHIAMKRSTIEFLLKENTLSRYKLGKRTLILVSELEALPKKV